jgi:fructose-1,6-bisphosphatase/inositol monophosphatase family enzyme
MKYAVVKPLFKKGDKSEASNYRPISVLSSFSKVLEKVMLNQLQNHLNNYKILAEEQLVLDLISQQIMPYISW